VLTGQALSAMQALAGYTVAPAYAAREEHLAGRIAPGFRADLTVFGADPRAVPANELPEVDIALTVVDGLVRHRGDGQ